MKTPELERILDEYAPKPKRSPRIVIKQSTIYKAATAIAVVAYTLSIGGLLYGNHQTQQLEARVDALEHKVANHSRETRIAEYDASRSRVLDGCAIGAVCHAEFRLRRTPFGVQCQTPSLQLYVVDSREVTRRAKLAKASYPVRVTGQWQIIGISFIAPPSAAPGNARFYEVLDYPGCHGHDGEIMSERTISIPFELSR